MSELIWPFVAALACVSVTAIAGILLTDLGPWYDALRKPGWKPPDFLFGPIWTTIFLLQAGAFAWVWTSTDDPSTRTALVVSFLINLALNVLWNLLFFRWRRPDWAQWETILLWLSVLAMMVVMWPVSAVAALLLLPYLVWVALAGFLTLRIVQLNAPFA